jgi:uncharacterized membrane protein
MIGDLLHRNALLMLGISGYAVALIVARGILFKRRIYRPMLLNITLAWIPYLLVLAYYWVLKLSLDAGAGTPVLIPLVLIVLILVLWFLFLPNSTYLITELHHIRDDAGQNIPLWYDIALVTALVLTGLLLGMLSLASLQLILVSAVGYAASWAIVLAYLVMTNFGLYLGRYLRLNSWDAFLRPRQLLKRIVGHLATPEGLRATLAYTVVFTLLLVSIHMFIFNAIQGQLDDVGFVVR